MIHNRKSSWPKLLDRYFGPLLLVCLKMIRKLWAQAKPKQSTKDIRILILKLSALGDVVVMLPTLRFLRQVFPEAHISFLGGPSNQIFFETFNDVITEYRLFSFQEILNLRKEEFTFVIDFEQWMRATAVISALMRTQKTLGFKSPSQRRHFAFDQTVLFDSQKHTAENFWSLATLAAKEHSPHNLSFAEACQESRDWVKKLAATKSSQNFGDDYVVLHPGCGEHGQSREWPLSYWENFISEYKKRFPTTTLYVTGSGFHEELLAKKLEIQGARSLVGQLGFLELMALLRHAKTVFVSNTGVMHLASLVSQNMVVLNGPTNSKLWGPLWVGKLVQSRLKCSPCLTWGHDYGCSDPVCLKSIGVNEVLENA